jgi:hypothetical protein
MVGRFGDFKNKEIIMQPTRTDLLNHLATKYNLKTYLEVGVQNTEQNFIKIQCEKKVGVDPANVGRPDDNNLIVNCTSDEYFKQHYSLIGDYIPELYDLVFLDGLHTAEQVKKDFENALKVISPNGFIVLHDCNPLKEEHTIVPRPTKTGHWHGDVFQFARRLFRDENYHTVDIDCGCGVYRGNQEPTIVISDKPIEWIDFENHRKELLRLISWEEFVKL